MVSVAHDVGLALPVGLARLRDLGRSLATVSGQHGRGLRVVVTTPAMRFAAVTAALGATDAAPKCADCAHAKLERGVRAATCLGRVLTDVRIEDIPPGRLHLGEAILTAHFDSVHRLPADFPTRAEARLDDEKRQGLAAWLRCDPVIAGKRLSAACAHPVVVVIGKPHDFDEDATALATWAGDPTLATRVDSGRHLKDWFRHPVIAIRSFPEGQAKWIGELVPRLVIVAGTTAWQNMQRWHWPEAPTLVLLSRRQDRSAQTASAITTSGWPRETGLSTLAPELLRGGDGLEVAAFREPVADPPGVVGHDLEDDW